MVPSISSATCLIRDRSTAIKIQITGLVHKNRPKRTRGGSKLRVRAQKLPKTHTGWSQNNRSCAKTGQNAHEAAQNLHAVCKNRPKRTPNTPMVNGRDQPTGRAGYFARAKYGTDARASEEGTCIFFRARRRRATAKGGKAAGGGCVIPQYDREGPKGAKRPEFRRRLPASRPQPHYHNFKNTSIAWYSAMPRAS